MADALKVEGNKAFAAKDYDRAIDLFSKAIDLDQNNFVRNGACFQFRILHLSTDSSKKLLKKGSSRNLNRLPLPIYWATRCFMEIVNTSTEGSMAETQVLQCQTHPYRTKS
jgi:tetratricopeptide (TPR) repeat protein